MAGCVAWGGTLGEESTMVGKGAALPERAAKSADSAPWVADPG